MFVFLLVLEEKRGGGGKERQGRREGREEEGKAGGKWAELRWYLECVNKIWNSSTKMLVIIMTGCGAFLFY